LSSAINREQQAPSSAALVAFTCITAAENVRFTIGNKAAIKNTVVEYKLAVPVCVHKFATDAEFHRFLAEGIMSRISTRDLRFLDRVIASDISYYHERISGSAAIHPLEPIVVQMDYTYLPFRIRVGCTDALPVPDTCKCDRLMQQKWDTMVELARKSKTPGQKLLIRAFIPCGSAPKVKLQLIPLKRIIPGYDPSQDHDPAEASDTFDHLYSCAGTSFTVVDHSYPVETLRLMNKEIDALPVEEKEDTTDLAQSA
jgi:hypothetical protein